MKKLETVMKVIAIILICVLCILVNIVEKNETCYHCVENLKIKTTMPSEHYPMKMYNPVSGLEESINTSKYINYKCKSKDCRCNDNCPNIYKTTK